MAIKATHELHGRRRSRNLGVGLSLAAFALIIFGLAFVKVRTVGPIEGFDHAPRPALAEREP